MDVPGGNSYSAGETELRKCSHAKLQTWLEQFSKRLKIRTNAIANEVQQVVDEMSAVELNLQNSYNTFRCLSTSQFIENRVYEEKEIEQIVSASPRRNLHQVAMATERYEDQILPRYREAVSSAWTALEGNTGYSISRSVRATDKGMGRAKNQPQKVQTLPYIIGTEDFARDITCGLGDLRTADIERGDSESEGDAERDGTDLATEFVGIGAAADEEPSRIDSRYFDHEDGSLEPAVSAALDFKAMLEAALRNPSLPYDGGTVEHNSEGAFGKYDIDECSLSNSVSQNLSDSPRTISTMVDIIGRTMSTMVESQDETHAVTPQQPIVDSSRHSVDVTSNPSLRSLIEDEVATRPKNLGTNEEDLANRTTFEELLKQSFHSQTHTQLNAELKHHLGSNGGSIRVSTSKLGSTSSVSGGLFGDEDSDTESLVREEAAVPNSNTGPTVPDELFQIPPAMAVSQHGSTDSLDTLQLLQPLQIRTSNAFIRSTESALDYPPKDSDRRLSHKAKEADAPRETKRSDQNLETFDLPQTRTALLPRQAGSFTFKGLFDDDDDEDEDSDTLFGTTVPKAESQFLRPWESLSSKSLFDGMKHVDVEIDTAKPISPNSEAKHEAENINKASSVTTSYDDGHASLRTLDPLGQFQDATESSVGNTDTSPVDPLSLGAIIYDTKLEGRKNTDVSIQSMIAAALQPSMPPDISSDEDSWSTSEKEEEDAVQDQAQTVLLTSHDSPLERLVFDDLEAKELFVRYDSAYVDTVPSQEGISINEVSSTASAITNLLKQERKPGDVALHEDHEPAKLPPSSPTSRSSSEQEKSQLSYRTDSSVADSEVGRSPIPEREPLLQRIVQFQGVQSASFQTLEPSEHHGSSLRESLSGRSETAGPPSQTSAKSLSPRRESGNRSPASNDQTPQVGQLERLTSGRTFTSLFEDDDAEDSLFSQVSPGPQDRTQLLTGTNTSSGAKYQVSFSAPTKSSKLSSLSPAQSKRANSSSSFSEEKRSSDPSGEVSNSLPSSSGPSRSNNSQSAPKSGSKLSALLFDDDDEEDEDALFGPIGEQSKWGRKGVQAEKNASLFGPSRSSSSSRSLFSD